MIVPQNQLTETTNLQICKRIGFTATFILFIFLFFAIWVKEREVLFLIGTGYLFYYLLLFCYQIKNENQLFTFKNIIFPFYAPPTCTNIEITQYINQYLKTYITNQKLQKTVTTKFNVHFYSKLYLENMVFVESMKPELQFSIQQFKYPEPNDIIGVFWQEENRTKITFTEILFSIEQTDYLRNKIQEKEKEIQQELYKRMMEKTNSQCQKFNKASLFTTQEILYIKEESMKYDFEFLKTKIRGCKEYVINLQRNNIHSPINNKGFKWTIKEGYSNLLLLLIILLALIGLVIPAYFLCQKYISITIIKIKFKVIEQKNLQVVQLKIE